MSDTEIQASPSNRLLTYAGILGCFIVFGLVLYISYVPNRPGTATTAMESVQDRRDRLDQLQARQQRQARSYDWVDRSNGVVQIPVERAVELTLRDLRDASSSPQSP